MRAFQDEASEEVVEGEVVEQTWDEVASFQDHRIRMASALEERNEQVEVVVASDGETEAREAQMAFEDALETSGLLVQVHKTN